MIKKPGKGHIHCPICKGTGTITEDAKEYEFHTRDPLTSRCLICDGSGTIGARTKLPDGTPASTLSGRSLNVSAKRMKREKKEDTPHDSIARRGIRPESIEDEIARLLNLPHPTIGPRLTKVLNSGKDFLVVTDSEPYYLDVYALIRDQERKQKTWDAEDEERYISALHNEIARLKEVTNG